MYHRLGIIRAPRLSVPAIIAVFATVLLVSHFSPVYADTYTFIRSINSSNVLPSGLMPTLDVPQGLAVDSSGNIILVDTGNNRVVMFNPSGTSATIISNFTGLDTFSNPQDVVITSSGFYVTDENNNRIVQFDLSGNFIKSFGSANLNFPVGIASDAAGNLYVANSNNRNIVKFDGSGNFLGSFTVPSPQTLFPLDIAVDPSSGNIYVTDQLNNRVVKFDNTGTYVSSFGSQGVAVGQFVNPQGIAVDSAGNVLVTDLTNGRVEKFYGNGTFITVFGSFTTSSIFNPGQFNSPSDVATDPLGNVYVTDTNFNNISVYNFAPGGSPPPAPTGLTATAASPNVILSWTASPGATSYTIYSSLSPTGPFSTIAGTTSTTTFTDTPSTIATYYEVSATSPSGQSGFSNIATPVTAPIPSAPTSVAATAISSSSITVSWTGSTGATSYTIYRSTSPTGPFTTSAGTSTVPTFTDTGLNPSTIYYYEITATNTAGTSGLSTPPASATTLAVIPPIPSAPTSVAATAISSSSITVSWTGSTGATSYTIYRSTSPTGPFTTSAGTSTVPTFTDTGLNPSTIYYYEITATNTAGTSGLSTPPASATTLAVASASCPPVPTSTNIRDISSYVIFGIHGVHVESSDVVSCGNVGEEPVNDEIHVEEKAKLAHSAVVGTNVHVEKNAAVYQIFYSRNVHSDGISTIAPAKIPVFFVSLPAFLPGVHVTGAKDITVANSGSAVLQAGPVAYGSIRVGNNAKLEFAGGDYTIDSITLGDHATLIFDKPTTIRTEDGMDGGQGVTINPTASHVDAGVVLFYVGSQVHIGKSSVVNANMYAHQEIHLEENVVATGAFIGSMVHVEENSKIIYDYGFPLGTVIPGNGNGNGHDDHHPGR